MGKYIDITKASESASPLSISIYSKQVWIITTLSLIGGVAILGISWAFLGEINQKDANGESLDSNLPNHVSSTGLNNKFSTVVVSVGILAAVLQLITSVGFQFFFWREKDSKALSLGLAIGQVVIQTVLVVCLGLFAYKFFTPSINYGISNKQEHSAFNLKGHGVWIILLANIIFHLAAIIYLTHIVMKRGDEEKMEEMTAVVIHRRVASRIPSEKSKRYARRLPSDN